MLRQLLSVFLESSCPLCDRTSTDTICAHCQRKIKSYRLDKPDYRWRGDLPVFAWGKYDGQLKQAIAVLKYNHQPEVGMILGQWLGRAWLDSKLNKLNKPTKITVIPIPLNPEKLKARGFNQALLIGKGFCQETGFWLQPQALTRVRNTKAMFDLNFEARARNLKNAFRVGKKLPRSPVLLLDDIYTSGTTVKEAAKVLRQQKVEVLGVVVVARAGSN